VIIEREFKLKLRFLSTFAVTVAVALAAVGLVGASSAVACSYTGSSHCYGSWRWTDPLSSFKGVSANISPTCLTVPSTGSNFATDEIWLLESLAPANWVEVGWMVQRGAFPGTPTASPFGFWVDQRPGQNWWLHSLLEQPLQSVHVSIERASASSFQVYFDGVGGLSTSNSMASTSAEIGSEITTSLARSRASFSGMYWSDGSSWHPKWKSSLYTNFGHDAPNTFAWTTQGSAAWAGSPC
jgi:hypothetical protein